MKNETGNSVKLGIFVTIGLALFIAGIYYVGSQQQLFNKTYRVYSVFNNVNGLQTGNNVRFGGITIGIIESVEIISDTSIRVDMRIDQKTGQFIRKDSKANIGSDGLMGNKVLNITPGSPDAKLIENEDQLPAIQPYDTDLIFEQLRTTTANAAQIAEDMSAITSNIRYGRGTIGKLFMDADMAENLDNTLKNVEKGSKGFEQNMEAAKSNILLRGYFKKKEKRKKKRQRNQGK